MEPLQTPATPLTRQEWLQEMGILTPTPQPLPWDPFALLGGLLILLALLSPLLHFFRRFSEPWPLARSLFLGALGMAVGLSGREEGVVVAGAGILGAIYALLLLLELHRRHWEDVKVLLMVPALGLVVLLLPYLFLPLVLARLWMERGRSFLFRSRGRAREEELRPLVGVRGRLQGEEEGHG